ncbi:MAG: hypothetical protein OXG79_13995 [Chloroflexi bacterium]|nr:hypothetical protein [Chloroflexota bacterium]
MTDAQVAAFDQERAREVLRNRAIRAAEGIGINRQAFEAREETLQKEMPGAGPGDVFWVLANERATSLMKGRMDSSDWHSLSMIYFKQARWLNEQGRSYWHLKREADKAYAQSYAQRGLDTLEIMADDCDGCRAFNGRRFPIGEAVKDWPIPESVCTADWCTCMWNLVVPDHF